MKLLHCETQGRNESLSVKTRFPTCQALCALSFFFHDFLPSRPVPLLLLYFSNSVFISLVYLFFPYFLYLSFSPYFFLFHFPFISYFHTCLITTPNDVSQYCMEVYCKLMWVPCHYFFNQS